MITRKRFIGILFTVMFFFAWYKIILRHRALHGEDMKYVFNGLPSEGLTLSGPVIIHRQKDQIRVFSSSCTHLGCVIDRAEDGLLHCPCHGSAYNAAGRAVKGPAHKHLRELEYEIDQERNKLIIQL